MPNYIENDSWLVKIVIFLTSKDGIWNENTNYSAWSPLPNLKNVDKYVNNENKLDNFRENNTLQI